MPSPAATASCSSSGTTSARAPRAAAPSSSTAASAISPRDNIPLVWEALHERGLLLKNAPHVVHDLPFVVPAYRWWDKPFYGLGLKVYELLAGQQRIGRAQLLSRQETLRRLPTLQPHGLRGGVVYHDGQFDDARLLIDLLRTAADHGAIVLNYAPVTELLSRGRPHHRRHRPGRGNRSRRFGPPAASSSTPPGPSATASATSPTRTRRRWSRRARGRISSSPVRSCPATAPCWFRKRPTAGCCSPSPGTATRSSARPTCRSAKRPREPRPTEPGDRLHPRNGRPLPGDEADAGRRAQHVRRHPTAGQGDWRHPHGDALPRAHHPHRPAGLGHDHRRQVDDLPGDGGGLRQRGGGVGRPAAAAVRDAASADSAAGGGWTSVNRCIRSCRTPRPT